MLGEISSHSALPCAPLVGCRCRDTTELTEEFSAPTLKAGSEETGISHFYLMPCCYFLSFSQGLESVGEHDQYGHVLSWHYVQLQPWPQEL